MTINFNVEPFFDDYSEDKKFYRILFRPGYAVQARELTQLQTIIQQQVKRHGDHIFKNGAMVIPGQVSYDVKTSYVKLKANTSTGQLKTFAVLSGAVGKIYEGQTSGVQALVLQVTPTEVVNGIVEPDTLFVKYIRGNGTFQYGEIVVPTDGSTGLDFVVEEFANDELAIGLGTTASIEKGVYYIRDNFVLVDAQTIVLDKYTSTPSVKAGLQVEESVVYPEDDESLLDNALGSPNYAAPGAARYYINLSLTKVAYEQITDSFEFIPLLTLKDGEPQFLLDKTAYAELEKTLARRTFDESGDYTVTNFPIQVKDLRNNFRGDWAANKTYIVGDVVNATVDTVTSTYKAVVNHTSESTFNQLHWIKDTSPSFNFGLQLGTELSVENDFSDVLAEADLISLAVEPGKAYVRGYEIEKIATQYLTLDKARTVSDYESKTIDTSPGNYIIIEDVNYLPDISTEVVFYDTYGTTGTAGLEADIVATARVKQIQLHSTGAGKTYKLFLFDVNVVDGREFERDAKFVFSNTGATTATRFSANIVPNKIQLTGSIVASTTSTTVTGLSTLFILDLKVGDYVMIGNDETPYKVITIGGNNTITIDTAISAISASPIYRLEARVNDPALTAAAYEIPRYAVKSTRNVQYAFYKKIPSVSSPFTTTENGYLFASKNDEDNYIVVNRATGEHLTLVSSSPTASEFTVSGDNTSTITITCGSAGGSYDIVYCLRKTTNAIPKNKVLTEFTVIGEVLDAEGKLTLDHADVFEIQSITEVNGATETDVTSKFSFDSGRKDTHYDLSSIKLKPGQTIAGGATLNVSYNYFAHQSGDFFTVDSYTHGSSGVQYSEIPDIMMNYIDFRPVKNADGSFTTPVTPKFGEETDLEYNYYLGRIDKLSLSKSGEFILTKGDPSAEPVVPISPNNSMDMYKFFIEPYTFTGGSSSVRIEKVENKRYTMRDIGRLEKRISNLEYYSTLSLLEQNTLNLKSYDKYGFERPQNGFIVDQFNGHGTGDVTSDDWKASVDFTNKELRPPFVQKHINLFEDVGTTLNRTGRNYVVNGDIVTLPFSSVALISQLRASKTESVNPFDVFTFQGNIELIPWSDTWFETELRPDIIINDDGQYNALVAKAEADGVLGTVWNAWQTTWTGEVPGTTTGTVLSTRREFGIWPTQFRDIITETVATVSTRVRTGTRSTIESTTTQKVIDDKIIETSVIPFMRSRTILFRGDSFKPETTLNSFFDNIKVNSYITPAKRLRVTGYGSTTVPNFLLDSNVGKNVNSTARKVDSDVDTAFSYGEVLKEYLVGISGVPTPTGVTCVVVGQETYAGNSYIYVDNIKGGTFSVDTSNTTYYLSGEFTSGNIKYMVTGSDLSPSALKTTYTGQLFGSFRIPNNTSIRFRTGQRQFRFTDDSQNRRAFETTFGETTFEANGALEVRQRTILSTRTGRIVSETVSETSTVQSGTTTRTRTTAWVDPLAQTFLVDFDGGVFLTSVDLFFSQKSSKVPVRIEIRETVNGYPGKVILPFSTVVLQPSQVNISNNGQTATNFKFKSPVYLQNNTEYALCILSDSSEYRVWIAQIGELDVNGSGLITTQPYNGVLFKSQNASTWTADQTQDLKFRINRASFTTETYTTLSLVNQEVNVAIPYDLTQINLMTLVFDNTELYSTFNSVRYQSGENIYMTARANVNTGTTATFSTNVVMKSSRENLSPVVDLSRCSAVLVENLIEGELVDLETTYNEGEALAKYITKQINLTSSATNLRVLFDANIPPAANIDLYYKIAGGGSNANFATQGFVKATPIKTSRKTQNMKLFTENEYMLENLSAFDVIRVKLVMKSTNTTQIPRIKDLRVIAYA